jgi:ATP-dependent DNA helicase RecG
MAAIRNVVGGTLARDAETAMVDFKIEEGRWDRTGVFVSVGSRHEPAARQLAREAACLANTTTGGVLVVGVEDGRAGSAALVGAESDGDWLRRRIHALTQPNLTVDVEEIHESGARLLLVNVSDALAETYAGNRLRTRVGTDCVELTGDRAREFLEVRRGYDWSAEPSGIRLSQATPAAIDSAAGHYARKHGTGHLGSRELASRLRVLVDDADDPELNRAGALLLCPFEPSMTQIDLLVTTSEGAASRMRIRDVAPILPLYDRVMLTLLDTVFPGQSRLIGGENQTIRALPDLALREAIVNAIMHRDYRIDRATIVALAIGEPADVLKVRSPGGFLPSVSPSRLLATQSTPRNPALAEAVRRLGLAEGEGVGIDSMFRVMLRDGHPEPEIVEDPGEVVVRLSGGAPDLRVRELFDGFARRRRALEEDVRAAIAVDVLTRHPVLRPERLAEVSQTTRDDAARTLGLMEEAGVVERLRDRSYSYRLTSHSRAALAHRIRYQTRTPIQVRMDEVEALLDILPDIGRADLVQHLKVSDPYASRLLRELVRAGRIEGTTRIRRGPNMRYRRPR